MKDIASELLERIRSSFNNRISGDKNIAAFMKKVQEGNASLEDLSLYGRMLGDHLADALLEHITQEALPDETLYFNIASRIIDAVMHDNYNLVNEAAARVQKSIDEAAGIGLNAVKAPYPEERVMGVINGLSQKMAAWEVIRGRMDDPIRNISQALVDDFIRANADFRHKAGMKTYIVRKAMGKCCEWCGNLAGSYAYPEDIPDDVFRRHDDCRCTVVFKTDKGIQNVWTKEWNDPADRAALEERKRTGNYVLEKEARIERAKKMAAAESERKEEERQKRILLVTKPAGNGIINKAKGMELFPIVDLPIGDQFIRPSEIVDSLNTSKTGQETLKYMLDNNVFVRLKYGHNATGDRGQQQGDLITIFLANNKNASMAACTVIHEITHHKYNISESQWAEAVCYVQEYKHIHNKSKLTFSEKREIIKVVKEHYSDLSWKGKRA